MLPVAVKLLLQFGEREHSILAVKRDSELLRTPTVVLRAD